MDNGTNVSPATDQGENTIPLKKALVILGVVAAVLLAAGLAVGYGFFWGKHPAQSYEDIVLEAARHRVKTNPKDAIAHVELGYAYLLRQGEDKTFVGKALQEFEKAYELEPKNRQVRYNLALGYIAAGKYGEAIKLLEPLAKEGILDFGSHFSLGEAYYLNKQYPEAVKAFSEAAAIRPGYADTYYYMGLTYEKMGDKENAVAAVEKALRLVPNYKEALELKARLTQEPAGGEKREP